MHILFYHQNYPAQFGHIARVLAERPGWKVTFVSKDGPTEVPGITRVIYQPGGGATAQTHYCARTFENIIWHSTGVFKALAARPDIRPDLVVGHTGFGSTLFLRDLYPCPQVNYFEYFYHTTGSDMDFRPDDDVPTINKLRTRARNAGLLLDLNNCDVGYAPTQWQRDRLPPLFRHKVRVIFDGIDGGIWKPGPKTPRSFGRYSIPDGIKLVTYAARGLESMRGFDIFMKFAKHLYRQRPDVRFVVVGSDRIWYGGDESRTGGKSYKQWVLDQDDYDLSKFTFTDPVPPTDLARLFQITDLHVYLTVPFVLSWSLFDALACGAVVLASDTAPVRELIVPGKTGLLADFFNPAAMAEKAIAVLEKPAEFTPLAAGGVELIRDRYSLDVCLPQLVRLYEDAANGRAAEPSAMDFPIPG